MSDCYPHTLVSPTAPFVAGTTVSSLATPLIAGDCGASSLVTPLTPLTLFVPCSSFFTKLFTPFVTGLFAIGALTAPALALASLALLSIKKLVALFLLINPNTPLIAPNVPAPYFLGLFPEFISLLILSYRVGRVSAIYLRLTSSYTSLLYVSQNSSSV